MSFNSASMPHVTINEASREWHMWHATHHSCPPPSYEASVANEQSQASATVAAEHTLGEASTIPLPPSPRPMTESPPPPPPPPPTPRLTPLTPLSTPPHLILPAASPSTVTAGAGWSFSFLNDQQAERRRYDLVRAKRLAYEHEVQTWVEAYRREEDERLARNSSRRRQTLFLSHPSRFDSLVLSARPQSPYHPRPEGGIRLVEREVYPDHGYDADNDDNDDEDSSSDDSEIRDLAHLERNVGITSLRAFPRRSGTALSRADVLLAMEREKSCAKWTKFICGFVVLVLVLGIATALYFADQAGRHQL